MTTSVDRAVPEGVRVECKTTVKKSRALRLDELHKIAREAKGDEIPVMSIRFDDERGVSEEFYVFPKAWALELLEAWRERDRDPDD